MAAAEATLRARLGRLSEGPDGAEPVDDRHLVNYVLDLGDGEAPQDFEPTPVVEEGEATLPQGERQRLQGFVRRAAKLRGEGDPKAAAVAAEVAGLLRDGFHPIVYCRYIATADYLAEELARRLKREFPQLHVISVTGARSEEEREQRVAELAQSPRRVLVATDCLSEGINLQEAFDAVLHYDLPWNPNRVVETVVRSLFQERVEQTSFLDELPGLDVEGLHREWERAADREKVSRSRFAQHAIKPEEVAQELYASDTILGGPATVASFVRAACERLGAPLQKDEGGRMKAEAGTVVIRLDEEHYHLSVADLPAVIREPLLASGPRSSSFIPHP